MSDGVLYVEIMPSTKGIGKAVEKDATGAFEGAEKTGKSFFQRLGGWAKAGAVAVGGMVAAVGALAIGGGISRALNIEDAQAKLKGLGHDTKNIESIMNDALASVKGTAFGLDAAATTAATAVAAGIKPGQELEKYLRLTADAATIAGVSMEEMGAILNKTTTAGKVYTQELNQLADKGLPVFQWLQEEYGVTAEELRKMVSAGEVDAERFRKVIEENIGGAALASGDTTRGAFANMRAALSRLGLVFVEDALGGAKTFFNEVTVILDGLADRFRPWVDDIKERFGDAFNPEGMGDRFLEWFDRLAAAISSGPLPQLLAALQPLFPVILEMAQAVGGALGEAFREVGEALAPVLPMLAETLTDAVIELAPPFTDLLLALIPLIPPLAELLAAVAPLAADLVTLLVPVLEWLADLLTDNAGAIDLFIGFMKGDLGIEQFGALLMTLTGPFGEVLRGFASMSGAVINWVTEVSNGVNRVISFITSLPDRVKNALSNAGNWLVQTGRDMIQGLINGVRGMIDSAVQSVKDVGGSMLAGVKDFLGINSPSRVFRDEVGKMVGLGLLEGIGDDAIQGRIDSSVRHMVEIPNAPSSGRAAGGVVQTNNFANMDPMVAVELAGRRLAAALGGA